MMLRLDKVVRGVAVLLVLLFCVFVVFWENSEGKLHKKQMRDHAKVIAPALWNLDPVAPSPYLRLAAAHNNYGKITVYAIRANEPFIEINGPEQSGLSKALAAVRLIPQIKYRTPIVYNGKTIGELHAVHRHGTVYLYFSILLFLGLILLVVKFFVLTLQGKQKLEIRVRERTKDLRKANSYISNIIDSMPSMLVGVDTEGTVTQWNIAATNETGIQPDKAVGNSFENLVPHFKDEMERITEAIRTRQEQTDLKRPRRKDGETRYEDVTIYPLIANGVEGAVIRIDDMTEQVRLEKMMVQSEKMLSVGGLAAGMAHEINNPLAGMMQSADNLTSRLTNMEMPANIKAAATVGIDMEQIAAFMEKRAIPRMVGSIRESGRRVAQIVDNMLSFARKSDSQVSSHNPAELMDKTLALAATDYDLKKQYDFKTICIEKMYGPDLPYIPCEGAKIQQVLLNIFRNGAQAMQEAAPDREHCFYLDLSHEKESGMVRLEIRDNGPGMDEETRKRVFEPFFTTKPVGVGTGLGLSVSYFIITENHGGEMAVESTPGAGTTFIIRLPVSPKKEGS